jgi:acetyltransferase
LVAELTQEGRRKILGVVRLSIEPDGKTAEIAFITADPWQGLGLASKMLDFMIEICKEKKLETIYGVMLPDNYRAINLMKKMGFTIERIDTDTVKGTLNLQEEDQKSRRSTKKSAQATQVEHKEEPITE